MDIKKIVETCKIPVSELSIKNKGSFVKVQRYYNDAWNQLYEKVNLKCFEKEYRTTDKGGGVKQIYFHWVAYKDIEEGFSRINFDFVNNLYFVSDEKIMGIINMKYVMELDYNRVWRNNPFLKSFLPYYIKYFYRQRIYNYFDRYKAELLYVKNIIKNLLNMAVFE